MHDASPRRPPTRGSSSADLRDDIARADAAPGRSGDGIRGSSPCPGTCNRHLSEPLPYRHRMTETRKQDTRKGELNGENLNRTGRERGGRTISPES